MKFKLLVIAIFSFFISVNAQEGWQLEKDKNGIAVYTRKGEDSKLKEYKGITLVDAPLSKVYELINNVSGWDKVMFKCKEGSAKVLKQINKNEYYAYMEISAPFPASNRDAIIIYKNHPAAADGSVLIEFKAAPNYIPEKSGLVRVPEIVGYWKLIPVSKTQTKVIHQALSAPGGKVPAGLANSAAVDAPYTTLEKVKELLSK